MPGPTAVAHLKAALKRAVAGHSKLVALDVFAGCGRVGRRLRRRGFNVISLDIKEGIDVTLPEVRKLLRGWISAGIVAVVMLAPPCASWSSARRGLPGSPGGPIRSLKFPMGLPQLRPQDATKIQDGNKTMFAACELLELCEKYGVPALLENPATSMMFRAPRMLRLLQRSAFHTRCGDFCQYGAPWRKRTKIIGVNAGCLDRLGRTCSGSRAQCSRTGRPHIVLQGTSPSGQPWTAVAEPYPPQFAAALAAVLGDAFNERHGRRLWQLVNN